MGNRSNNGTSLVEQALFYFVRSFFPDASNRHMLQSGSTKMEVDIYIPSLNLAIEYDGRYWHENKLETDNKKTRMLNESGFSVLHVREYGLSPLDSFFGHVIELPYVDINDQNFDYINRTLDYLSEISDDPVRSALRDFYVDDQVYAEALKSIYAMRYATDQTPNLSDMCGIELWDTEKNSPLIVTHIAKFDWVPSVLVCPNKMEIELPRYHREYKSDCSAHGASCDKCCYGILCPLLKYCVNEGDERITCEYVEQKIWNMIKRGMTLLQFDGYYTLKRWLTQNSDIAGKLVEKYLSYEPTSRRREDIAFFLGMKRETYRKSVKEGTFDINSLF